MKKIVLGVLTVGILATGAMADKGVADNYYANCAMCHGEDGMGAPVVGDKKAWATVTAKGMDVVYANAINGLNGMPAKGGTNLADTDLKAVVDYMINSTNGTLKTDKNNADGKYTFKGCTFIEDPEDPIAGGVMTRIQMGAQALSDRVLTPRFGSLESIPIQVSSKGTPISLKIGWAQLLQSIAFKGQTSKKIEDDMAYLSLPIAWNLGISAEEAVNKVVDLFYQKTKEKKPSQGNGADCTTTYFGKPIGVRDIAFFVIGQTMDPDSNYSTAEYILFLQKYANNKIDIQAELKKFNTSVTLGKPMMPK